MYNENEIKNSDSFSVLIVKPNTAIGVGLSEFISVGEGESINISCTSAGVPVPSITWTFNGQLTNFSQTDTIIENQGYVVSTLHIVHARYELHDGVYQCAGSNYGGDPTKSAANITVQVLGMHFYACNLHFKMLQNDIYIAVITLLLCLIAVFGHILLIEFRNG